MARVPLIQEQDHPEFADVIEKFRAVGSEPVGGTPEQVERFFTEERVRWKQAVDVAKLQKM